uniref:Biogenesis of lysosome-related organelles complex 1 subunit 2 n=1 Tax=Megaselia scalaris TaxID=36166 RepID=T1GXU3_MEGSC
MNTVTASKYSDMKQIADNLQVTTNDLNGKFRDLIPLMQQIDEIDETVDKLEAAAYKLDAYSIALENKIKNVLKKS